MSYSRSYDTRLRNVRAALSALMKTNSKRARRRHLAGDLIDAVVDTVLAEDGINADSATFFKYYIGKSFRNIGNNIESWISAEQNFDFRQADKEAKADGLPFLLAPQRSIHIPHITLRGSLSSGSGSILRYRYGPLRLIEAPSAVTTTTLRLTYNNGQTLEARLNSRLGVLRSFLRLREDARTDVDTVIFRKMLRALRLAARELKSIRHQVMAESAVDALSERLGVPIRRIRFKHP